MTSAKSTLGIATRLTICKKERDKKIIAAREKYSKTKVVSAASNTKINEILPSRRIYLLWEETRKIKNTIEIKNKIYGRKKKAGLYFSKKRLTANRGKKDIAKISKILSLPFFFMKIK